MDKAELGRRIRKAREKNGAKIEEISFRTETIPGLSKVTPGFLSEVELGKKSPSTLKFASIIKAMDASADEILWEYTSHGRAYKLNELTERLDALPPAQLTAMVTLLEAGLKILEAKRQEDE